MRCCWIVVLASCGFPHGSLQSGSGSDASPADDAAIDDSAMADEGTSVTMDAPPDSVGMGAWANIATVLPGAPVGDDDPSLTGDLLEIYFNRNNDIYVAKRASLSAAWGTPARVDEVSSVSIETTPEITSDGLVMFLSSDKTPTTGGEDIWMSTRASRAAAWGTPAHVDQLSSATDNAASAPTDDLLAIVQIGNPSGTDVQLFMSTRANTSTNWPSPGAIAGVNSTASDFSPMLSQDRKTIYFDSARSGDEELYVATRAAATGAFNAPTVISELCTVNTQETDPWVSPDGHHIFFVRDSVLYEAHR
jgi:hypothetical protein